MKKLKTTYWLLGFGCGIILSGIAGAVFSLNIKPGRSDLNNTKEITVIEENNQKQIEKIDDDIKEEYKTEKYEKETINVEQKSSDKETVDHPETIAENIEVYIPSQSRAIDIAQILELGGIIEDSNAFVDFIKEKNKATKLKHGKIIFSQNSSYEELLEILTYD